MEVLKRFVFNLIGKKTKKQLQEEYLEELRRQEQEESNRRRWERSIIAGVCGGSNCKLVKIVRNGKEININ
jgi:hypothetical protein